MITILRKMGFIAGEISYALAIIAAIILMPFALLIRAAVEVRAAVRHGQTDHRQVKPVYS